MMGNMMVRMRRLRRMVNHDDKYFMQHSEGDGDDEYEYDNDNFCAKVSRSWSFPDGTVCYLDRSSSR